MKLKCRIKEKEYDIVQGATFSEEYNETLDSGSIILDHISKIKGLKPFDDVYVWNADEEFNGYYNIGDIVNAKEANVDINISEELSLPTSLPEERIGVLNIIPYVNDFKLYGSMIDLWSYFTFEETDSTSRYSLGLILIKVTMINAVTQDEYEGYYYLPYSSVSDTSLVLHLYTADTDNYPYSTNCPSDLTVSYIRQTSTFGSYLVYGSNGFLIIRHTGVFGNDDIYTIKNIEPLSSYTYEEDNSKTEGTLTINGLTQKELLSISGLQLSGLIKGRYITMDLDSVEEESENKVTLIFKTNYYISKNKDNKAFCLVTLESEDSTSWSGTFDAVLKAKVNEAYSPYFDVDDGNTGNYYYYFDTIENNFENVTFERQETSSLPSFFKHLLIDKYEYEMIDLDRNNYKYTLSLMSETKRLEKIVCPNISITQPIAQGVEKRTILYYLQQYLNLYSPKIKKSMGNNKWIYVNKYCLDLRSADCEYDDKDPIGKPLKAIFTDDLYAPEMSLSAPTLREVLSRLMIVKDCIPVVKNDVIYAMKISDTHGEYIVDKEHENFIYGSMDSDSFSTALRKEHQGAISQKNTAHMVEYLGFRNSSSALLTLDNLEVETKFPIYKINKMYLCYYRTVEVTNITTNTTSTKTILVKQDITRLVLQNTVRNTLPADWTKYPSSISKFDEMSQYKLLTVGYDIGSNKIGGWGETYSYVGDLLGWTSITKTYIETMLNLLDYFFPYGVSRKQFLNANEYVSNPGNWIANIVPYRTSNWPVQGGSGDIAAKIKSIFFKIDYNAMYSGTIVHTKDNIDEDDYETTDNNSSSLSILEVDGLYAKEKANRFANPTKSWPTRYKSYEEMNNTYNHVLGSIRYDEDEENDVIVYHREYQIYDGVVLANFVGMRDYVMKNYYTSVFAKYRTYSYASYNESVERKENDRYNVILSLDKQYYENGMIEGINANKILSAFNTSRVNDNLVVEYENQINGGYFSFDTGEQYFSDVNNFVSGYSICFNMKMYDTLTAGVYISSVNCFDDGSSDNINKQYVGSSQDWYKLPVKSDADGFLENIGCYFGHFTDDTIVTDVIEGDTDNSLFENLFALPLKNRDADENSIFGKNYAFCKDDKEIIDYTLQYELINYDKDNVLFSEWLMKLSEFGNYTKFTSEQKVASMSSVGTSFRVFYGSRFVNYNPGYALIGFNGATYEQAIVLRFKNDIDLTTLEGKIILGASNSVEYAVSNFPGDGQRESAYYTINLDSIEEVNSELNYIIVNVTQITHYEYVGISSSIYNSYSTHQYTLRFEKLTSEGESGYVDYYYHGQNLVPTGIELLQEGFKNCAYNGKDFPDGNDWNANLTTNNAEIKYAAFSASEVSYIFPQTMYILTSKSKLENNLIYDQLDLNNLPEGYNLIEVEADKVFEQVQLDEYGRPYIQFNALSELGDDYESVQYWYLDTNVSEYGYVTDSDGTDDSSSASSYTNSLEGDNLLHFVFGVNRTKAEGDAKIYISILKSRRKEVYDSNHRIIGEIANTATDEYGASYGNQEQIYTNIEEDS